MRFYRMLESKAEIRASVDGGLEYTGGFRIGQISNTLHNL